MMIKEPVLLFTQAKMTNNMTGITRQGAKVTIDFSVWYTQEQYAELTGVNPSTVRQWVSRVKRGKSDRLDIVCIPELNNIYLVRKNTGAKY